MQAHGSFSFTSYIFVKSTKSLSHHWFLLFWTSLTTHRQQHWYIFLCIKRYWISFHISSVPSSASAWEVISFHVSLLSAGMGERCIYFWWAIYLFIYLFAYLLPYFLTYLKGTINNVVEVVVCACWFLSGICAFLVLQILYHAVYVLFYVLNVSMF